MLCYQLAVFDLDILVFVVINICGIAEFVLDLLSDAPFGRVSLCVSRDKIRKIFRKVKGIAHVERNIRIGRSIAQLRS